MHDARKRMWAWQTVCAAPTSALESMLSLISRVYWCRIASQPSAAAPRRQAAQGLNMLCHPGHKFSRFCFSSYCHRFCFRFCFGMCAIIWQHSEQTQQQRLWTQRQQTKYNNRQRGRTMPRPNTSSTSTAKTKKKQQQQNTTIVQGEIEFKTETKYIYKYISERLQIYNNFHDINIGICVCKGVDWTVETSEFPESKTSAYAHTHTHTALDTDRDAKAIGSWLFGPFGGLRLWIHVWVFRLRPVDNCQLGWLCSWISANDRR